MALLEYIDNKHFTEPLLNTVWQSNKHHESELDNEYRKRNGKAIATKSGIVNNFMANTLQTLDIISHAVIVQVEV